MNERRPRFTHEYFDQIGFDVRCEWGLDGLTHVASTGVVIIVDVLSFTTSVDIAVNRGAAIFPYRWKDKEAAETYAIERNAELAGTRGDRDRHYSLAPSSLVEAPAGLRLVLPSPNGSTLAFESAKRGVRLVAGSLRNASAVAAWAKTQGGSVLVVPAGERWPNGNLRVAVEDFIGAGAILSHMSGNRSPEATAAVSVFEDAIADLTSTIRRCSSGKELTERGFARDIELATELNVSSAVPVLEDDRFINVNA